jgi:hypothetical protein
MAEKVRGLADDVDEACRTQGQRALERVIEKPGDDEDTHYANREGRCHGDSCQPVFDPGKRHEQRQQDCEGDQRTPQRKWDAIARLKDSLLALRVRLRQKRQNFSLVVLRWLQCRRDHSCTVHSADLQIDGLRRLVVLTPDLVDHEGEEHSEHHTELQKDNGTDIMMMTAQIELSNLLEERRCEHSNDARNQYD